MKKLTLTFELPQDFTTEEIASFQASIETEAFSSVQDTYKERGKTAAENMKIEVVEGPEVE